MITIRFSKRVHNASLQLFQPAIVNNYYALSGSSDNLLFIFEQTCMHSGVHFMRKKITRSGHCNAYNDFKYAVYVQLIFVQL